MVARDDVLNRILGILDELTGDWDDRPELREDATLLGELGLESIDIVALGTAIEEAYQRTLPYAPFVIEMREQGRVDFTVGELVDFVARELNAPAGGAAR